MTQSLERSARKGAAVEKVTAFIMGRRAGVDALLFLYHPYAGIQLPAGTVEVGESARDAALREAGEESGLQDLAWGELLGEEREELAPDKGVMAQATPVYTRPDLTSHALATMPRGWSVDVLRGEGDFLQISYSERDSYPNPTYESFKLVGWVPSVSVGGTRTRYFAHILATGETPDTWTTYNDNHMFTLRWHRLDDLPQLVAPQAPWMRLLPRVK